MVWTIKWEKRALLKLQVLDKPVQKNLLKYLRERIETAKNPKQFGKGLVYEK